jgi:ankyrin repeat protein
MKAAYDSDVKTLKKYFHSNTTPTNTTHVDDSSSSPSYAYPPNFKEVVNYYDDDGNTVLMTACGRINPIPCKECVALILTANPRLNDQNKDGFTAMMLAGRRGHSAIVEMLLSRGAEFDLKCEKGKSTLELCTDTTSQV